MSRTGTLACLVIAAVLALPGIASALDLPQVVPERIVLTQIHDRNGELLYEQGIEAGRPDLLYTLHYLRLASNEAKPGGGGADPGTDCESDAYKLAGWHWTTPFSTRADSNSGIVSGALNEWDANTGASISGGASGGSGPAGVLDGVNQIVWQSLGASSTVAVTTTWSYRGSGEAVESDGQYNTYYAWSTNGAANAMDVESVVQHEVGHTYGLNHPTSTATNDCLTMYAYVNYGWTHGRTLGDGDILGIKAIYGN